MIEDDKSLTIEDLVVESFWDLEEISRIEGSTWVEGGVWKSMKIALIPW